MPSPEAILARKQLHKEQVDTHKTAAEERKEWDDYAITLPLADGATQEEIVLGGIRCSRIKPLNGVIKAKIIYAHGGGLTTGSIYTHRSFVSHMAIAIGCEIILPDYRLLPENEISVPSNDVFKVLLELIANNSRTSNVNNNINVPLFIGGDSSGGGLALTAAKKCIDQSENALKGCFSISGAFDASLSSESHINNSDVDPILSLPVLQHWQTQLGEHIDFENPVISPLFADLKGLPPTLLLAGEDEVWRDDTLRMHNKLIENGVACEMKVYQGMWHVWPMTPDLPETEDAFAQILQFIETQLDGST